MVMGGYGGGSSSSSSCGGAAAGAGMGMRGWMEECERASQDMS